MGPCAPSVVVKQADDRMMFSWRTHDYSICRHLVQSPQCNQYIDREQQELQPHESVEPDPSRLTKAIGDAHSVSEASETHLISSSRRLLLVRPCASYTALQFTFGLLPRRRDFGKARRWVLGHSCFTLGVSGESTARRSNGRSSDYVAHGSTTLPRFLQYWAAA